MNDTPESDEEIRITLVGARTLRNLFPQNRTWARFTCKSWRPGGSVMISIAPPEPAAIQSGVVRDYRFGRARRSKVLHIEDDHRLSGRLIFYIWIPTRHNIVRGCYLRTHSYTNRLLSQDHVAWFRWESIFLASGLALASTSQHR